MVKSSTIGTLLVLLVSVSVAIGEVSDEMISEVEGLPETQIKKLVGEWLESQSEVIQVYEEKKNHRWEKWPVFEVRNSSKYPDLLVKCRFEGEDSDYYIAIELKNCDTHMPLIDGYDSVLQYFVDYSLLGAEYYVQVEDKSDPVQVNIDLFALATNYSPLGFLYREEGKYDYQIMRGWKAYPSTATYA